jgi:hypothetical protein
MVPGVVVGKATVVHRGKQAGRPGLQGPQDVFKTRLARLHEEAQEAAARRICT